MFLAAYEIAHIYALWLSGTPHVWRGQVACVYEKFGSYWELKLMKAHVGRYLGTLALMRAAMRQASCI